MFLQLATAVMPCQNTPSKTEPDLFEFHSDFLVNLHHFLYWNATASSPQAGGRSVSLAAADIAELQRLSAEERKAWDASVEYYKNFVIKRDLLFDRDLAAVKNQLEDAEGSADLAGVSIPADLKRALLNAAPIYRKHWWIAHDAQNKLWISQLKTLLSQYGSGISADLVRIYGEPWPGYPVRVDAVAYANWAGAYTTIGPTRPTISTTDPANQGPAALEIVFHETSHGMMDKLMEAIDAAEKQLPDRNAPKQWRSGSLWHAVLFYTAGQLTAQRIAGYVPYADKNGLWRRAWPDPDRALIEQDWKPHMNGSVSLQSAVSKLTADCAAQASGSGAAKH